MKSLLIDALRAANESESAIVDESENHPEQVDVSEAETSEEAPQPDMELELLVSPDSAEPGSEPGNEPGHEANVAYQELNEYVADDEDSVFAESIVIPPDAAFVPANDHTETRVLRSVTSGASGNAATFERLAIWTPIVCLFLGVVSTAAFSGWSRAAGGEHNVDLRALSAQGYPTTVRETNPLDVESAERFALAVTRSARPAVNVGYRPPQAPQVQNKTISINRNSTQRRKIAGVSAVDEDSFSSLESAFSAYLGGEVSRSYIEKVLAGRVEQNPAQSETDIKLLLQHHADSAPLHYALGTLLSMESRFPEANLAFARAIELNANGVQDLRE